jgi:hypothetical protein
MKKSQKEPARNGRTTRQMVEAPEGAFFVWVNHQLGYPQHLAYHLGRRDLKVVSPGWVDGVRQQGMHRESVVVDHACELSMAQEQYLGRMAVQEQIIQENDVNKIETYKL